MPNEDSPKPDAKPDLIEVFPSNLTRPSITLLSPPSAFSGTALSMSKANWRDWKWDIEGALGLTGLWDYVLSYVSCPDKDKELRAYRNWRSNDCIACLYIDSAMDRDEAHALNVRNIQPATDLWDTLQKKYANASAVSQFTLLEQVFHTELEDRENLLKSFNSAVDLTSQAFSSKLTKNTFQVLVLTHMISNMSSLSHIKSTIHSKIHCAAKAGDQDSYTIDNICSLIVQRQTKINSQKCQNPDVALAAAPAKKGGRVPIICENCNGRHHMKKYCVNEGGGMFGSTVDQLKEAKHKDREAAEQVKGKKSEAHVTTPTPATANFASHPLPSTNIDANPQHAPFNPHFNEAWFSLDEPTLNIDWNVYGSPTPADDGALNATLIPQPYRVPIAPQSSPFIIDSGSSIHLSPHRGDFLTLNPITPRPIKGVGGSCIQATGMGSIKLHVSRGSYITLHNALYIPTATICLLSVFLLARDTQIVTQFNNKQCRLIQKTTRAIIATGSVIPSRSLYSMDLFSTETIHTLAATSIADFNTWHKRLGHTNA